MNLYNSDHGKESAQSQDVSAEFPVTARPGGKAQDRLECATLAHLPNMMHKPDADTFKNSATCAPAVAHVDGFEIHFCDDLDNAQKLWMSFQTDAISTAFQQFEWLNCWHGSEGRAQGVKPLIVFVVKAGLLKLIFPLCIERSVGANRLAWLGSDINDYNVPLIAPGFLDEISADQADNLWRTIIQAARNIDGLGIDYVHLIKHPEFIGGVKNPFAHFYRRKYSCGAHSLVLKPGWTAFYQDLRGTKSRRRLREKTNKLKKHGKLRLRQVRHAEEKLAIVQQILGWKKEQLNQRGSSNPFACGAFERFLTTLAKNKSADKLMRVYVLELDDTPLAGTIAMTKGREFNFFIPAHNNALYPNCSAGTIMLLKLMELSARARLNLFDFSLGDEGYKFDWCDQAQKIYHSTKAVSPRGLIFALLAGGKIALKRIIKSNPKLYAMVRWLKLRLVTVLTITGAVTRQQ